MTEEGGGRKPRGPATASGQKLNQYLERRYQVLDQGTEARRRRRELGRPDARDRIDALVDAGSFAELDMFASARATGLGMEDRRAPGDGVVAGVATIDGRDVALYAFDPTVLGGTLGEVTAEKIVKIQELALRSRIPIIGLNDSGGARIQEGVAALAGYASIFYRNVRSSGVIPQLSVICGPCTDEAVLSPALTDFVFVVAGSGHMPGLAHFLAEDEEQCWRGLRRLVAYLPSHSGETPPFQPTTDPADRADLELQTLVPESPDLEYDMHEVVTRLLDDRQFLEVQPLFAQNVLVGFGRLGGHAVGVVANQPRVLAGAIDTDASTKAARFIRFCDAFEIPLVSLVDAPGYVPGTAQAHGRIVRHGAKLLYAYAEATVPKLAVITRKDHGGAYCVMSPKQMGADLNLAWPTAEIAVMGPEAAVDIVHRRELEAAADPAELRAELLADYTARFANPYVAAERGYVDDVIEPRETRRALVRGLELCLRKTVERPARKHGNIPL